MSPFLCHFSAGRTKKDGDWGGVDKVREGGRSSDTRYGVVTLGGGGLLGEMGEIRWRGRGLVLVGWRGS